MTPTAHTPTAALPVAAPAWTHHRYGGPEMLELAFAPLPTATGRRVLVRVEAAAVDRGTWHLMRGIPLLMRLGTGLRRPRHGVPGRDLAGVVVAVGPAVTRHAVGDRVLGMGRGSLAAYALADERRLAARPEGLEPAAAAILPISGVTALQAIDMAAPRPGARVLITGASGGVGSFAVQIAVARGARVTAVYSGAKADHVRALGAHAVIDRTAQDPLATAEPYDAIIDIAGNAPLRALRRALTPRGSLVIVGSQGSDGRWTAGFGRAVRAALLSPFVGQRLRMLASTESGDDLVRLLELVAEGRLRPPLDAVIPFADAPAALGRLEQGGVAGKVAVAGPPPHDGRSFGSAGVGAPRAGE